MSSAIASNLAKGFDLETSVCRAKDYISGALSAMLDLGKGSGPMDHGFAIDNIYTKEADINYGKENFSILKWFKSGLVPVFRLQKF